MIEMAFVITEEHNAGGTVSKGIQTEFGSPMGNATSATASPVSNSQEYGLSSPESGYSYRPRRSLKLSCPQCDPNSITFRSEHELRRHTNRLHRTVRKVWVTVDASPDKTFLAGCKACTQGKQYNECYNAASHLRRMHFHPCKRGEGGKERRLSERGELDPSMDVLKGKWLKEIEVVIGEDGDIDNAGETEDRESMSRSPTKNLSIAALTS